MAMTEVTPCPDCGDPRGAHVTENVVLRTRETMIMLTAERQACATYRIAVALESVAMELRFMRERMP
jgi:hypothetical protein